MIAQKNPGYTSVRTATPRKVFDQAGKDRMVMVPGGVVLDSTHSYDAGQASGYEKYIRGGCFLAWSTTQNKWAPCKRTRANGSGSSSTTLTVDDATHFRPGDSVIVGGNAAQTIVSVDSTTQITLTSAITWKDNEPVYVDQWKTARAILVDDEVILRNYDGTSNNDQKANAAGGGSLVDWSALLGDKDAILSDPDAEPYLRGFTFKDFVTGAALAVVPFGLFGLKKCRYVHADYTVTAADNGTLFIADAAVNFTLPTKAAGLAFGFYQTADANMGVLSASSSDDIVTDGDSAADSVTYSTSSHKKGAALLVMIAPDLTQWLSFSLNPNAQTIA